MVPNELMELIGDQDQTFWRILQRLVAEKLPPDITAKPVVQPVIEGMSNIEANAFEKRIMPFGIHVGTPIGEIGCDYLIFMAEGTEFTKELKRYCASERFFNLQKWDKQ